MQSICWNSEVERVLGADQEDPLKLTTPFRMAAPLFFWFTVPPAAHIERLAQEIELRLPPGKTLIGRVQTVPRIVRTFPNHDVFCGGAVTWTGFAVFRTAPGP
jgi:hypothetical protein